MVKAFFGGVHPDDMKAAVSGKAIEQIAPPGQVVISMSQHSGKPCTPTVRTGDSVRVGQRIGEPDGADSAPVHASVSGTVTAVEPRPGFMGEEPLSVAIKNDFQDTLSEEVKAPENPDVLTPAQLMELVKSAGIAGMASASTAFIEISGGIGRVDTVIVDGAECQPCMTADYRTMLERPGEVIGGATLLARMFGLDKVHVAVTTNRMDAIGVLTEQARAAKAPVIIHPLRTRYPQGAEKQICQAVTGRMVPPGKLPAEIGCAVFNVSAVCAIYRAVTTGMPVVKRVVTVAGSGVISPKNLECPIGTQVSALLDACGGLRPDIRKLILGGPMTGTALNTAEVPVDKGISGVLAFTDEEGQTAEGTQCIRCGRCVSACPMRLEPLFLYQYAGKDMLSELEAFHLTDCIECGACSYICPARLDLTDTFKAAKRRLSAGETAQAGRGEEPSK